MNNLKAARTKAGYTQAEVGEKIGVTQSTYSYWESGKSKIDNKTLAQLATLYGASIDYLVGRTGGYLRETPPPSLDAIRVPVLGCIQAGVPIEAIEDIEGWEELPAHMASGGREYFALRIRGDSMNSKYEDGDVVIFRRQETCDSGDDCAVMVNGDDATFKRVRRGPGGIILAPLNPTYEPLHFTNKQIEELPVVVLGVAIELRRPL